MAVVGGTFILIRKSLRWGKVTLRIPFCAVVLILLFLVEIFHFGLRIFISLLERFLFLLFGLDEDVHLLRFDDVFLHYVIGRMIIMY
jgi:hypothetical protein